MSVEIPLAEQIDGMQRELALRQRVYPGRVSARQMTQTASDAGIARIKAILKSLESLRTQQIEASISKPLAPPPAPSKELPRGETPEEKRRTKKLLQIEPTLHEIHICASRNKGCESCRAIAQLMEDSLGFTRR